MIIKPRPSQGAAEEAPSGKWVRRVVLTGITLLATAVAADHYQLSHPRPPLIEYRDSKTISGDGPFAADVVDDPPEFVVNDDLTFGKSLIPGTLFSGGEWISMVAMKDRSGEIVFRLPNYSVIGWLQDNSLIVRREGRDNLYRIPGSFFNEQLGKPS